MTIPISEQLKVRKKQDLNLMINPTAQAAKKAKRVKATPKKATAKRVTKPLNLKKVEIKNQATVPIINKRNASLNTSERVTKKVAELGYPYRSLPASINNMD